ncbi:uncharacterized protein RJT21DRAFT_4149 [Scheffersomyces amazonensis]|uniref:uncharacterized protein n=1 Tax=Scheffersomyces amazonensis TaxID=1078765 RepID=UPI00315DA1EF
MSISSSAISSFNPTTTTTPASYPFAYPTFNCGAEPGIYPGKSQEDMMSIYECGISQGFQGYEMNFTPKSSTITTFPPEGVFTFPILNSYPTFACGQNTTVITAFDEDDAENIYTCGQSQGIEFSKEKEGVKSNSASIGKISWLVGLTVFTFLVVVQL